MKEFDDKSAPVPTKRGKLAIILVVVVFAADLSWDAYEPYWSFECKSTVV